MVERPITFSLTFMALFALSFAFLAAVDSLPDPAGSVHETVAPVAIESAISNPELPVRIKAPEVGIDVGVANPQTTDVDALDVALLSGVYRDMNSAPLGVDGTVVMFGHSSHLPIVHNGNYKAFNGVADLKEGDSVNVYSATAEYRYRVIGVRLASATEDVVELQTNGKYLVLVTCDNFKLKTDRWVATAEFVGAYTLQ